MNPCSVPTGACRRKGFAMFENAVRQVYASTMDISALEYRRQRGLEGKDEQMAVLVQRVSGSYYGNLYMPLRRGSGIQLQHL